MRKIPIIPLVLLSVPVHVPGNVCRNVVVILLVHNLMRK